MQKGDLIRIATEKDIPKKLSDLELDVELGGKGRSKTIVIANHTSNDNSKLGADIVINSGEDAAVKINSAINTLGSSGGIVLLMEGIYDVRTPVIVEKAKTTLQGIPGSTILKQASNWETQWVGGKERTGAVDSIQAQGEVQILDLIVDSSATDSRESFCAGGYSIIKRCTALNSNRSGFHVFGNTILVDCSAVGSKVSNYVVQGSAIVKNSTSKESKNYGFSSSSDTLLLGCISESDVTAIELSGEASCVNSYICNSSKRGISVRSDSTGVIAGNSLNKAKLVDNSSGKATIEYNAVKEA